MPSDRVKYSFGLTVNTGNYNSARFDVEYETDVQSDETPEEALKRAQEFVEEKVGEKKDELGS